MSRRNAIQAAIKELDGGQYQNLMDDYLCAVFDYPSPTFRGSKAGTNKTTKGTPDTYWRFEDGTFIFAEYGAYPERASAIKKIREDIAACKDVKKAEITDEKIKMIICCYTCENLSQGDIDELSALDSRVKLIGPDEVAVNIAARFPRIAEDHLHIGIDSGQIYGHKEFIEYNSRIAFSSPLDTPLVGREHEMEDIEAYIDSYQIVQIIGRSGSGKTRIALEACKIYSSDKGIEFKIIKSNNQPILEDLETYFSSGKVYLLLVDDANELSRFDLLIDFCVRHPSIKLVITIRDYARPRIENCCSKIASVKKMRLEPLSDETVKSIVETAYGVMNPFYEERILQASHGNMRIISMACVAVKRYGYKPIENIQDLLEVCYGNQMRGLSENEVDAATIMSILGPLRIDENEDLVYLESLMHFSHHDFISACSDLHRVELVNASLEMKAVALADQSLRDYLLYKAICVNNTVSLEQIWSLQRGRNRTTLLINAILGCFSDDLTVSVIKNQINIIWDNADCEEQWDLAARFHSLLSERVIRFLYKVIEDMPEEKCDYLELGIEEAWKNQTIESRTLNVISNLLQGESRQDAFDLVKCYLKKNNTPAKDFYRLFSNGLSFSRESPFLNYKNERKVFDYLAKMLRGSFDSTYAICLIIFTESILRSEFTQTGVSEFNKYTFYRAQLMYSDELYRLREDCINMLCMVLKNNDFIPFVSQSVSRLYFSKDNSEAGKLSDMTIRLLNQSLIPLLPCNTADQSMMAIEYERVVHWFYSDRKYQILALRSDKVHTAFTLLCGEYYDLSEQEILEKLCPLGSFSQADFETLFDFIGNLNKEYGYLQRNLSIFLEDYMQRHDSEFLPIAMEYLNKGLRPESVSSVICNYVYQMKGPVIGRAFFVDNARSAIGIWLANFDSLCVSNGDGATIADNILASITEYDEMLDEEEVFEIETIRSGFYADCLQVAKKHFINKPWAIQALLPNFNIGDKGHIDYILNNRRMRVAVEDMLIATIKEDELEGVNDGLINVLLESDFSFSEKIAREAVALGSKGEDCFKYFKVIWGCEDYREPIQRIVDILYCSSLWDYEKEHFLCELLLCAQTQIGQAHRNEWICDNALIDGSLDVLLAEAVTALPYEVRSDYLCSICAQGVSIDEFEKISLMPLNGVSWSGSELPTIDLEMSFLRSLKTRLSGDESLPFRLHIQSQLDGLERYRKEVSIEEFLDPYLSN